MYNFKIILSQVKVNIFKILILNKLNIIKIFNKNITFNKNNHNIYIKVKFDINFGAYEIEFF